MKLEIGVPSPNHTTIGIPSPDPFGDYIKAIVDGEKIWPASGGDDLEELEVRRRRLAHEIFAGAELVDLVGHSTPINCYLKLGDWVLDPAGAERLASFLPKSVKIVRLIGCSTASTVAGRAAAVALTRSSVVAYGTLNKVYSTHFDKDGVKKVPGAPPLRGFFPAERECLPAELPTSSDMADRSRSRGLLPWLGRGTWRALSGLYRVFIRLLPEQWTLRSRIWGLLHSNGESMPGLLTEPLCSFAIASRSGDWMLEILFDFEHARFYPSGSSAEARDLVYGIRGFGRAAKTPLEAYLERGPRGVTLKKRHEEAGDRCAGALPKGGNGGACQKPGRPFWFVSLVVTTFVALAVLLARFTLPMSIVATDGGVALPKIPSDAPADGGEPPPQISSDAPADGGEPPPQIPSDAPADGGGTSPPIPPDGPGSGGLPLPPITHGSPGSGGEPPSCATLPPTATYAGFVIPGGYTSPRIYDPATCHQALSIQINRYSSSYVGAGDTGGMSVVWADAGLATKSACEAAWVQADLYRQISGQWTRVSGKQSHGTWTKFFDNWICTPPGVGWRNADDDPDVLIAGSNYRIVSTARTSSSGATRKFRVSSQEDDWIR